MTVTLNEKNNEPEQSQTESSLLNRLSDAQLRFNLWIHHSLSIFFQKLGRNVVAHPYLTILICFLLFLSAVPGLLNYTENKDQYRIWSINESLADRQYVMIKQLYGRITNSIVILFADAKFDQNAPDDAKNVATKSHIEDIFTFHEMVMNLTFTDAKGDTRDYTDVCEKSWENGPCRISTILDYWNYNQTDFDADPDILATMSNNSAFTDLGFPISLDIVAAGVQRDGNDTVTHISSFRSLYFVLDSDPMTELFEKELWDILLKNNKKGPFTNTRTFFISPNSVNSELDRTIGGDVMVFVVAFVVMFLYTALNIGGFPVLFNSKIALAFLGILCILLGIFTGWGYAIYLGYEATSLTLILPFVATAIGIDDLFVVWVMIKTFGGEEIPLETRVELALGDAGPMIVLTTITDFFAFLIGAVTSGMPAVQWFAFYAAFSIFFIFLFIVTMFVAFIVLDGRRVRNDKLDCLCCVSSLRWRTLSHPWESPPGSHKRKKISFIENLLTNYLGKVVTHPTAKPIIIILFLALFIASCVLIPSLSIEFAVDELVPDDSYLLDFTKVNNEFYSDSGESVGIYIARDDSLKHIYSYTQSEDVKKIPYPKGGPAFHIEATQAKVLSLESFVNSSDSMTTPFVSWFDSFVAFYRATPPYNGLLNGNNFLVDKTQFYNALDTFTDPSTGPGRAFGGDFALDSNGELSSLRVFAQSTVSFAKQSDGAGQMVEARMEIDKLDDFTVMFPFTHQYLFFEQILRNAPETIQNVIFAVVVIILIALIFMPHPRIAFIIVGVVAMADISLIGFWFTIFEIAINPISSINILMGIGLLIDFAAHVAHGFSTQTGKDNDERVIKTLGHVGSAVIAGGCSTILGVTVLGFSQSSAFRVFFKSLLGVVVLGISHGIILLPVLLSYFGPPAIDVHHMDTNDTEDDKDMSEGGFSTADSISPRMSSPRPKKRGASIEMGHMMDTVPDTPIDDMPGNHADFDDTDPEGSPSLTRADTLRQNALNNPVSVNFSEFIDPAPLAIIDDDDL